MKTIIIFLCIVCWVPTQASGVYRAYLLSKATYRVYSLPRTVRAEARTYTINCPIPKITTPKGNVFCRLEDKLMQATKIWIKVGVK